MRSDLRARTRALRRSVHLRHADAGSDGTEEWEILALLNPVYDIHRLGMFFTASPRHADVLLVTGAGARGMTEPLRKTYDAMPHPKVVIAVGTDAVSGGLPGPSYATAGGIGGIVPIDVWLPGSPPSPFSILYALLLALGRLPAAGRGLPVTRDSRRCSWRAWRCWPSPPPSTCWPGCAGGGCSGALSGWRGRIGLPGRPPGPPRWPARPSTLRVAGLLGPGTTAPAADPLSGLFLLIAFGAAVPISLALMSWAPGPRGPRRRGLAAAYALALGAVAVVLTATDAFTLLFAWESVRSRSTCWPGSAGSGPGARRPR